MTGGGEPIYVGLVAPTVEPVYRMRYFFDWGIDTCLWSGDERTRDAFGSPIDPRRLSLLDGTIMEIERMCA